jgi:hypothetical protein
MVLICPLWKVCEESLHHMLISCDYVDLVWKEIKDMTRLRNVCGCSDYGRMS